MMKVICTQCGKEIDLKEENGKLVPDKCPVCQSKIIGIKSNKFGDHLITVLEDKDEQGL